MVQQKQRIVNIDERGSGVRLWNMTIKYIVQNILLEIWKQTKSFITYSYIPRLYTHKKTNLKIISDNPNFKKLMTIYDYLHEIRYLAYCSILIASLQNLIGISQEISYHNISSWCSFNLDLLFSFIIESFGDQKYIHITLTS